jgi:hypothetical protein
MDNIHCKFGGDSMKVGDLVKWEVGRNFSWLAIVVDDQIEEGKYGAAGMLVQWVTGNFIGEEEFIAVEDLEVIA